MTNYKKYLFLGILALMFVPLFQQFTHVHTEKPLIGFTKDSIDTAADFSMESWWEGKYQAQIEGWVNKRFGFRTDMVRIYNQLNFSLFRKSNLDGLKAAKEDYLFQSVYYESYTGVDSVKKSILREKFLQIKMIQDSLEKTGKTFFFLITPNKADFFVEYLPDNIAKTPNPQPNYKVVLSLCKELGIHTLDFNAYFLQKKNKTPYPLFPKNGIHWSSYGETLVMDSLIHYIENQRNVDMPEVKYTFTQTNDNSDDDLQDAMNLLYPLPTYPLAKPTLTVNTEGKQKLKVLWVGDSFGWMLLKLDNVSQIFEKFEVWHYYQQKYLAYNKEEKIEKKFLKREVYDNQVIILEANSINFPRLGWGFLEDMNAIYSNLFPISVIEGVEAEIRKSPDWFNQVKAQAKASNISEEACLRNNAIYFLQQQNK